jgi:putative nucleotidyltransferase-like protein
VSVGERPQWLPTETEELLLRAALLDGDEALEAWRRWRSASLTVEDETLAFQVLPLAYRTIHRLDPGAEGLDLAKGVYRYVWVKNQVLARFGGQVIDELQSAGIDVLVLKGTALSLLHYRDTGLRLMADIDLLVPREEARRAISVMGKILHPKQPSFASEDRVLVEHGTAWVDGSGNEVDLHWYSLWLSSPDAEFWEGAVPIEVDGVRSRSLCPTDHLLHVCAHGASWHPEVALRWVTDAATVIRSTPSIDWERLVAQARRRELTITLGDALGYLRSAFGVQIPAEVLEELHATPTTLSTRAARRALTRPPTMVGVLSSHWDRYRRIKRLDPGAAAPSSFPAHLRTSWGFDSYGGLLKHAAGRLLGLRPRSRSWRDRGGGQVPHPDP